MRYFVLLAFLGGCDFGKRLDDIELRLEESETERADLSAQAVALTEQVTDLESRVDDLEAARGEFEFRMVELEDRASFTVYSGDAPSDGIARMPGDAYAYGLGQCGDNPYELLYPRGEEFVFGCAESWHAYVLED